MKYFNLTDYEKSRFRVSKVCPICGNQIDVYDDFIFKKLKKGKFMQYIFMHTQCYKISQSLDTWGLK